MQDEALWNYPASRREKNIFRRKVFASSAGRV
jgi:hypothetical protein